MRPVCSPRGRTPRRAALVIAAAAVLLTAVPAARAALTASIADLALPPVTSTHSDQTSSGTMTLTVSDTGLGPGWNVTVQTSGFAYSGSYGGTSIPAANFSITAAANPVRVSGQAMDPTGGPKVPPSGATGSLDVARKTIQAEPDHGVGTYTQALSVALVIPANTRAGTYTAGLTVTASEGP